MATYSLKHAHNLEEIHVIKTKRKTFSRRKLTTKAKFAPELIFRRPTIKPFYNEGTLDEFNLPRMQSKLEAGNVAPKTNSNQTVNGTSLGKLTTLNDDIHAPVGTSEQGKEEPSNFMQNVTPPPNRQLPSSSNIRTITEKPETHDAKETLNTDVRSEKYVMNDLTQHKMATDKNMFRIPSMTEVYKDGTFDDLCMLKDSNEFYHFKEDNEIEACSKGGSLQGDVSSPITLIPGDKNREQSWLNETKTQSDTNEVNENHPVSLVTPAINSLCSTIDIKGSTGDNENTDSITSERKHGSYSVHSEELLKTPPNTPYIEEQTSVTVTDAVLNIDEENTARQTISSNFQEPRRENIYQVDVFERDPRKFEKPQLKTSSKKPYIDVYSPRRNAERVKYPNKPILKKLSSKKLPPSNQSTANRSKVKSGLVDIRLPKILHKEVGKHDKVTRQNVSQILENSYGYLNQRMLKTHSLNSWLLSGSRVLSMHQPGYIHNLVDRLSIPSPRRYQQEQDEEDRIDLNESDADYKSSAGSLMHSLTEEQIYELTNRISRPTFSTRLRYKPERPETHHVRWRLENPSVSLPNIENCRRCKSTPSDRFASDFSIFNI